MSRHKVLSQQCQKPLKIGITGGVGSGKSLVCKRFKELGVAVASADELARQAVEPGTRAYKQIAGRFGKDVFLADKTLDRARLRQIITRDDAARKDLESYVHPEVGERMKAHFQKASDQGILMAAAEVPLLFEAGLKNLFDAVILVTGDQDVRIARIMQRDNVTRDQALALMSIQMPEDEKRFMSDFVIENNKGIDQLRAEVDRIYEKLAATWEKNSENG
jgi:dephospho-CoA kinase